jgi:hypothetical protein
VACSLLMFISCTDVYDISIHGLQQYYDMYRLALMGVQAVSPVPELWYWLLCKDESLLLLHCLR